MRYLAVRALLWVPFLIICGLLYAMFDGQLWAYLVALPLILIFEEKPIRPSRK